MKIKTVTSALALLAFAAPGLAMAKEHQVIITGLGFFPATTYVQAGDTVQFINAAENSHHLVGEGSSWELVINPAKLGVLTITGNEQASYHSTSTSMDPGFLSFSAPPEEALTN